MKQTPTVEQAVEQALAKYPLARKTPVWNVAGWPNTPRRQPRKPRDGYAPLRLEGRHAESDHIRAQSSGKDLIKYDLRTFDPCA